MVRKHGFVPSALHSLEPRVVLSKTTQGLAVVVSGLSPHLKVLNRQQQAMSAEILQAFATFQSDYDQARATYFASIQSQTTVSAATSNAFTLYTSQRSLRASPTSNRFATLTPMNPSTSARGNPIKNQSPWLSSQA